MVLCLALIKHHEPHLRESGKMRALLSCPYCIDRTKRNVPFPEYKASYNSNRHFLQYLRYRANIPPWWGTLSECNLTYRPEQTLIRRKARDMLNRSIPCKVTLFVDAWDANFMHSFGCQDGMVSHRPFALRIITVSMPDEW